MHSIFIRLTEAEEKEIFEFMIEEGCRTKSGFFMLLLNFYKHNKIPEMRRLKNATSELEKILRKLNLAETAKLTAQELAIRKTMEEMGYL